MRTACQPNEPRLHGNGIGGVGDDQVVTDEPARRPGPLPQPTSPASTTSPPSSSSIDARLAGTVDSEGSPAAAPEPGKPRAGLPRWTVPVVAVLVLGVTVVTSVLLWRWVDGLTFADADKKSTAYLDVLKLAASIAVGGGGLFALYLAARRQRTQELELEKRTEELAQRERAQAHAELVAETNRLHAEKVQAHAVQIAEQNRVHAERVDNYNREDATGRRVTELYTKAVEQLGSDKAAVRHGGLYALERVAQDNTGQRQTVINVICAYLRSPYTSPPEQLAARRTGLPAATRRGSAARRVTISAAAARRTGLIPPTPAIASEQLRQEREVRLTAQRILTAHLHPDTDETTGLPTNPRYWPEGYELDLTGAILIDFDATGLTVRQATFTDAQFTGDARFDGAAFTRDARFGGAAFTRDARFGGATFTGDARFGAATFTGDAWFDQATFTRDAWFDQATFTRDAQFDQATFTNSTWFGRATFMREGRFDGTTFIGGAWFDQATFARDAQFRRTRFTSDAQFNMATFTGDALFNRATFIGDAQFGGATFIGDAQFGGATFIRYAEFDLATFTGPARFSGATFADVVVMKGATAAEAPTDSCAWPTGWTVDDHHRGTAAPGKAPDMLRLVPVPVVLAVPEPSDGSQGKHGGSSPE
ncbi:pentapeptide repeat-containing protein [Umezawaea sp. Da 62-37]|uniref:pentapeptide repeat-containing protein n=1 Tax=Umezawaea sp. Da 62-37 TaxID=3075927 RepID=UPI0028F74C48|nr:pentapeptide repeat-containing protein [Umezawaea sp. Da 62-37]WNV92092.1 pentapeptide repeat-containing protein [Umezawaea sp. Da 62-37]